MGGLLSWLRGRRRDAAVVARDQIVDSIGEPVLVIDRDRAILDMNLAAVRLATRLAGGSPEWRGARVEALFPFLANASITDAAALPAFTVDTASASYDVRVSRMRAGRAAWLVLLRDVTEDRRAIAAREQFFRQHAELVSSFSHELRTPLAAIQGALQLVLGNARSAWTPEDQRLLESALRSCERLAGIAHDILDISTIDSPQRPGGARAIAVERLLLDALFDAGRLAAERSVRIQTSVDADLPMVRGEHDRLVQVFVTLLTKAVEVSSPGSTVTVSGRRSEGWVSLAVEADGDGRTAGPSGSGVSALSKALVEQHGGQLTIQTGVAGGTTFLVRLPQADGTRAQAPRVTPATVFPLGETQEPASPAQILVADDDPDLRDVVGEALEARGFTVLMAEDGRQAEELLARERVDLAVLDLNMPHRTGEEVIRAVRAGSRQPGLPIVVLTGSVDERESADHLGADALLTKPTSLRRLVEEINTLLGRRAG